MDIYLQPEPEGDSNASFRLQNEEGEEFRTALVEHGENLIVKANLVYAGHGALIPGGMAATLLIFEFRFISENLSRRFKRARITLTFSKVEGSSGRDPEVNRIAPEDVYRMNKTTTPTEIRHKVGPSVKGGVPSASVSLAYEWEVHKTKSIEHFAQLTGVRRVVRPTFVGPENTVVWSLTENRDKMDGIPSFLRAAVVVARRSHEPFIFFPEISTEVDFATKVERLFGKGKPEPVDTVKIEPGLMQVKEVLAKPLDLAKLAELNLWDHCSVKVASLIEDGCDRPEGTENKPKKEEDRPGNEEDGPGDEEDEPGDEEDEPGDEEDGLGDMDDKVGKE